MHRPTPVLPLRSAAWQTVSGDAPRLTRAVLLLLVVTLLATIAATAALLALAPAVGSTSLAMLVGDLAAIAAKLV